MNGYLASPAWSSIVAKRTFVRPMMWVMGSPFLLWVCGQVKKVSILPSCFGSSLMCCLGSDTNAHNPPPRLDKPRALASAPGLIDLSVRPEPSVLPGKFKYTLDRFATSKLPLSTVFITLLILPFSQYLYMTLEE